MDKGALKSSEKYHFEHLHYETPSAEEDRVIELNARAATKWTLQ